MSSVKIPIFFTAMLCLSYVFFARAEPSSDETLLKCSAKEGGHAIPLSLKVDSVNASFNAVIYTAEGKRRAPPKDISPDYEHQEPHSWYLSICPTDIIVTGFSFFDEKARKIGYNCRSFQVSKHAKKASLFSGINKNSQLNFDLVGLVKNKKDYVQFTPFQSRGFITCPPPGASQESGTKHKVF